MKITKPTQTPSSPLDELLASCRFDSNQRFQPPGETVIRNGTVSLIRKNCRHPYAFDAKRIRTPEAILCWTHHLCSKGWMDCFSLKMFIETVAKHNHITMIESS
jgi:hypothetical protein